MKVLLVDNLSVHLSSLKRLISEKLGDVEFIVHDPRQMKDKHLLEVELVIFSGGTGRSIEKNRQTFDSMVDVAKNHKKPTMGICLGAEAIAARFGPNIEEIPTRRVGNVRSFFTDSGRKQLGISEDSTMAYEFHKWVIKDVKELLKVIATSKDGIEVFRHTELPMWGMQFHPEVRHKKNKGHLIFECALREMGLVE